MMKIGFCFLIYDTINCEELWDTFFKNIDPSKYGIYIHYKTNTPLNFFEKYKLKECIPTKYADVSLIHAHNLLFKAAYDDGCDKFINLSQACIPLKSFNYIYDFLTKDDKAYFNSMHQSGCFPRYSGLLKYCDKSHIKKSSEWFILNRTLANFFIKFPSQKINVLYGKIFAPEECFYITSVHEYGLTDQIVFIENIRTIATTFTNWKETEYKNKNQYKYPNITKNSLKNYSDITEEELEYLISSQCLFGRKFNSICMNTLNIPVYINCITTQ